MEKDRNYYVIRNRDASIRLLDAQTLIENFTTLPPPGVKHSTAGIDFLQPYRRYQDVGHAMRAPVTMPRHRRKSMRRPGV